MDSTRYFYEEKVPLISFITSASDVCLCLVLLTDMYTVCHHLILFSPTVQFHPILIEPIVV